MDEKRGDRTIPGLDLEEKMDAMSQRQTIEQGQLARVREMLAVVLEGNRFYRNKYRGLSDARAIDSMAAFKRLPFTLKTELVRDQAENPPFGAILTFPVERYLRIHQTSGTSGNPLYWLDTAESWDWWTKCWKTVFEGTGVRPGDRIYFPFSFGPFIGFWSAWDSAHRIGALAIAGGGQATHQRLKAIVDYRATVVVCTPTYALRMAAEAANSGIDLTKEAEVRVVINAGEPGASIPATKKKIEDAWGARCYDHAGATEVGAWGFECEPQPGGVHVNEEEFLAEVIDPETGADVADGEQGELVITNLGRTCSPVIRYRTGDCVQAVHTPCPCGRPFVLLEGGVIGRVDDMFVVRGVNVFPSAIENLMRQFPEVNEYRIETYRRNELQELRLVVEPVAHRPHDDDLQHRILVKLHENLGLRPEVEVVAPGTLPHSEHKSRRFVRL